MDDHRKAQSQYYIRLVQKLMNTSLLLLDRKLVPNEYPERALVPALAGRVWDDVMFGGILFSCERGQLHEIDTYLGFDFTVLQLPGPDGFAVLGPYVPSEDSGADPERAMAQKEVPPLEREAVLQFRDGLPILSHDQIHAALSLMDFEMYGERLPVRFARLEIADEAASPCPVFTEDVMWVQAEVLAARYAQENEMLDKVLRGEKIGPGIISTLELRRLPDPVRNAKNTLIILNSLLRKNLERAKIHPFYIDRISSKWAVRIETITSLNAADTMIYEMLESYSQLVRRRSQANYTHNVRAAVNYLQFHLADSDLSLRRIAAELGVNASYLSQQFNRETGKRLTEYLAELRVEEAKQLLRSADTMPISQVAAAVGYNDVNYFSRTFRKYTGKTPTEFRNEQEEPSLLQHALAEAGPEFQSPLPPPDEKASGGGTKGSAPLSPADAL